MYCKQISNEITSIRQVFQAPDVQLSDLKRECYAPLQSVLIKFLEGMLYYYGRTKEDMSDVQVKMVVDDIINKYYYFRIEDVCLCFKMARTNSAYKDFYGRIDGSVIMSWFATYDKERDDIIHSLPVEREVVLTGNEISRDEYLEQCRERAAKGDMEAIEALDNAERVRLWMFKSQVEYGNYKYQRAHKYDDKPCKVQVMRK